MCDGDGSAGVGFGGCVVVVSAHMGGTRGSGALASACNVREISVVRGVGGGYDMCMRLARGGVGGFGGEWVTGLGLSFANSGGTWGKWDMCLCFGCGGVGGVGESGRTVWARVWEGGVMAVCVVSLDSLCRWQVQVSVYCARRIPAHLRCTQCSILWHLIDICFLTCICLWQISQIQTCLRVVVGPGLISTSSAFMRSIVSHPAGPHGRLTQKR